MCFPIEADKSSSVDDISVLFSSLLYKMKAYLLKGSSRDKDNAYFQYHVGRVSKLIHKLNEKGLISATVTKCFNDFKQVLLIMRDYALQKVCGKY